MSSLLHDRAALRRPNGRLQACDPCHRRKVACDHNQPVCNRCRARNQTSECVYLVSDSAAKRRRVSPDDGCGDTSERHLQHPPESPVPRIFDVGDGPSRTSSGFLGSISYSSVYDEARQTLSLLQGLPSEVSGRSSSQEPLYGRISSVASQSPPREQCFIVLRTLATMLDLSAWERVTSTPYETWSADAALRIVQCLRREYSQYLIGSLSDAKLERMASEISNNTSKPFSDDIEDAELWFSQFCGPRLRWESLGLLFTFREVRYLIGPSSGNASNPGSEGISGPWMERRNMANICMGICIDLSRRFSAGNSVLLMTCLRRTALETQISGDASLQSWQAHAQAVSLLTFLGFHADPAPKNYQPSLCSEIKRMLAIYTFIMDKVIVFFTGRPPQINRRYFTAPAPLDLEGADLYKNDEERIAAAQLLDRHGWNKDGKVHNLTSQRARFINSILRDEIIDIALFETQSIPLNTILDIRQRQLKAYGDFPQSVVYKPGQVDDLTVSTRILAGQILLRLEHLQNIFVLDRLLLRHGYDDKGKLLETSYEMLATTLLFWRRKDRFSVMLEDFSWIVMAFGTSAGGILCMELLNPTFTGFHPLNKEITRSNIIQQLSLLVAFLDWVPPNGPNANLCQNCSSVVQSILDHALNSNTGASWPPTTLENIHLDFNFELLDSFDWMRATEE